MKSKAKIAIPILTTVVMMALLMYCIGCKAATGTQVGDKATDFNLYTLTGEKVHLRDLEGKPIMFTFWTTGCGACIYQMPFLQAAKDELTGNVTFIEIDIAQRWRYGRTVPRLLRLQRVSRTGQQCLYGHRIQHQMDTDECDSR